MALTYFTLAELRGMPDLTDAYQFGDERLTSAGEYVEAVIERVVGTSFVARTVTGERHDGGSDSIALDRPYPIAVSAATEDGVAVTDTLRIVGGLLRRYSDTSSFVPLVWNAGVGNVTVTYTAGYSTTPPADIKEAALRAARFRLLTSHEAASVTDRALSISNEFGNVQLSYAGLNNPFGLPDVDAVIVGWRDRLGGYGFA